MIMKLRPVGNKLLVQPLRSSPASELIEIVQLQEEFGPKLYRVLAIGPAVKDLVPGDRVLCYSIGAGPVDVQDGSGRKIVTEDQVIMIVPTHERLYERR